MRPSVCNTLSCNKHTTSQDSHHPHVSLALTRPKHGIAMSQSMCGTCCLSYQEWNLLCCKIKTRSSWIRVRSRALRREFIGLFLLLLGGESCKTAVHVVARLSSHVFTVAAPSHGRYVGFSALSCTAHSPLLHSFVWVQLVDLDCLSEHLRH